MSAQHTPTPLPTTGTHPNTVWRLCAGDLRFVSVPGVVKPIDAGSHKAAAEIVRACNAHDELVAALREMTLCFGAGPASEEWWEAEHDRRGPGGDGLSSEQIRNAVTERASAALAKAGEA